MDSEQDRPGARAPDENEEPESTDSGYETYHGRGRSPATEPPEAHETGSTAPAGPGSSPSAAYETYRSPRTPVEDAAEIDDRYLDEADFEASDTPPAASTAPADRVTVPPRRRLTGLLTALSGTDWRPRKRAVFVVAVGLLLLLVASVGTTVGVRLLTGERSVPNGLEDVAQATGLPALLAQYDVAVDAGSVYVLDPLGRVISLDASSLEVEAEINDPTDPTDFPLGGPPISCGPKGLTAYESETLRRLWTIPSYCTLIAADTGRRGVIAVVQRVGDHARLCLIRGQRILRCITLDFVPTGIGIGPNGTVYVADGKNDRIVPFKRGNNGRLRKGEPIDLGPGANPHGDIIVKGGTVYVSVTGGVAYFDASGQGDVATYQLKSTPSGIWISPDGLLVAALYHSDSVVWFPLSSPNDVQSLRVEGPAALDGDDSTGDVFVLTRDRVLNRIDPDSGTIVASTRLTSDDPPEPASIKSVEVNGTSDGFVVRLEIEGGPLTDLSLIPADSRIGDGRASILLWQGGIGTQVQRARGGPLEVRLHEEPAGDLVRVVLGGPDQGELRAFKAQLAPDGKVVTLAVRRTDQLIPVPRVVGLPRSTAERRITDAGLAVGPVTDSSSETVPEGYVISSSPRAGTLVEPDARVILVISSGSRGTGTTPPVTVPSVAGLSLASARSRLLAAGLRTGSVTSGASSTVPTGRVISSSPAAGARVPPRTAVDLVVSSGPPPIAVPNLVGMNLAAAKNALAAAGLTLGSVTCDCFPEGPDTSFLVNSQNPGPGTLVEQGTAVNFVIRPRPIP